MEELKRFITKSIKQLISRDKLLFQIPTGEEQTLSSRKLHEVCINHRLAIYMENNLEDVNKADYSVDIEYNRNFELVKRARRNEDEDEIIVRPNILIHKRANQDILTANYLVVEAKKGEPSLADKDKIERLMMDTRFKFKYGLTISYLKNPNFVICEIYFLDRNSNLQREFLPINKNE